VPKCVRVYLRLITQSAPDPQTTLAREAHNLCNRRKIITARPRARKNPYRGSGVSLLSDKLQLVVALRQTKPCRTTEPSCSQDPAVASSSSPPIRTGFRLNTVLLTIHDIEFTFCGASSMFPFVTWSRKRRHLGVVCGLFFRNPFCLQQ
jgi:hypothetical protein